ncbi:ArnT family glycosyltransferase [Mucilaginibacter sp. KACC 22063]|uniref:ArnT family glycosyltransferase n=1 Tax=Mucilaginibacter sp. KACC 22063 TaxID=3025666 RepID=UPI002366006D|nr:hypothetical protein [Mucilaginibacter sp. KACC 22063]WDF53405.1 hypothetical protein PQ461_10650 [Mucilaginibacter sp. KACC 22063]
MTRVTDYIKNLDALVAAIIGYYVIYLFTKYNGVGISPDSIMYISTARNVHDHGAFTSFTNKSLVDFPVFYPAFLAFTYFISGIDPLKAGPVIDGLLFASVIFISGWLMQRFAPKSIIYKWLILAVIILNPALLQVYTYMWSETLFIIMVLLFFIAFSHYLNTHTYKALIVSAIIAGIACITRYAGITVIGAGGLLLLIDQTYPFKKRWGRIFTFGFVAIAFLVINLVRNHLVTGTTTGPREASVTSFGQNLAYVGSVIMGWISIINTTYMLPMLVGVLVIVALIIALLFHTFRRNLNNYLIIAIAFSLVYILFMVLSATFSRYEQINNRLLAPVYVPLVWALTWWIIHLPARWPVYSKWIIYGVLIITAIFIEYRLYKIDYQRYDDQYDYGNPGYTDDDWKESGTVDWIRRHPQLFKSGVPIYSDAHEAVYWFSGQSNTKLLPHKYFKKDTDKFYAQKHYYIIWFNELYNAELVHIKDIQQHNNLKKLEQFDDGAIYEYNESENAAK